MIRLYVAAAVLAIAALGWWRYDSVIAERDGLKTALSMAAEAINQKDGIIEKERSGVAEAATRAEKNLQDKRAIENEAKSMRDCIADKSCGVRVQWKVNACPNLPGSGASRPGSDSSAEPDTRDFETWVVDLEESVKKNLKQIEQQSEDIKIRAAKDYCKPLEQ